MRVRRVLARIDIRLTLLLAGVTAALTSLLLCGLVWLVALAERVGLI